MSKISGPIFDRIDLHFEVPAVSATDLRRPHIAEALGYRRVVPGR